jgi:chromosome segregation ATPase
MDRNDASMSRTRGEDPFGLVHRRRRRIPASLESYLAPQADLPPRQQAQRVNTSSASSSQQPPQYRTPQKEQASSTHDLSPLRSVNNKNVPRVETTMESTTSHLTTPVSNQSPQKQSEQQQQQMHPSPAQWNISRISPQDTLSILTPPHDEDEQDLHRVSTTNSSRRSTTAGTTAVDASVASQTMRKQMLQLVHSLQTNLNESQAVREEQQQQLNANDERMVALQKQVEELQDEKKVLLVQHDTQKESWQRDCQELQQTCRDKDMTIQTLEQRVEEEVKQTQQVQSSLHNLRLEHASLAQQLQQQADADQALTETQKQVKQMILEVEEQRLGFEEKQDKWHQEQRDLHDEATRIESVQTSLQYERQLLTKERQQVQSLQTQLVEMQATQIELEETQRDEDDRLMQISHQLDERHVDLEYREGQLAAEQKQLEVQQRQQEEDILEREAHLQESAQSIVSQQAMLETWNGTLQEQQTKLEEREMQVKDVERALSTKVDDLKRFETKMRFQHEEMQQRAQSYEAKRLLTVQALEDLTGQRIEQETRLEVALLNLEEVEGQTTKIKAEHDRQREEMSEQLLEAQKLRDGLNSKITTTTEELEMIQQQSQAALQVDEENRQEALKQEAFVHKQLERVQDEIEDAESHKATLHLELLSLKGQLEAIEYAIRDERAAWEEQQAAAVEEEDARRSEQLDEVRREIQEARETAKNDFETMQAELQIKQDEASNELIQQMDQIEHMRANVEAAAKSWMDKHNQLEEDQEECASQQRRLDQLVAQLEGARDDQEWRRDELNRERQRLEVLLDTERQNHRDEMQQASEAAEERIEELKQEHGDDTNDMTKHYDSTIAELEIRYSQIQQQLAHQELQHQAELTSITYQKEQVEAELVVTQRRAEECELELSQLQVQIANLNSADSEEREKIRLLMEQLETSNTNVERKENDLAKREDELREQKEQTRRQANSVSSEKDDLQHRLRELRDKENKLATVQSDLEKQEAAWESKKVKLDRKLQRSAMQHLMHKSWREDKEIISAAFSKWLRVTMMESTFEEAAVAEQGEFENLSNEILHRDELLQLKEAEVSSMKVELQETKSELEIMKQNHAETSEQMEAIKADLDAQTAALHEAEDTLSVEQMQSKMQNMEHADALKVEREKLALELRKLESDRAVMTQLDKFLQTRQKEMSEQERNRKPPKETAALQHNLAEESKQLAAARAELGQKEEDILERIEMVQEAETRVLIREQQLSTEAAGYKRAEDRVRKLAKQLHERETIISQTERQLAFSMKEFNEAQLRVRMMAQKLKEKDDELEAERERLGITG